MLSAFADLSYRVSILFPEGVTLFLLQHAPVRLGAGVTFRRAAPVAPVRLGGCLLCDILPRRDLTTWEFVGSR